MLTVAGKQQQAEWLIRLPATDQHIQYNYLNIQPKLEVLSGITVESANEGGTFFLLIKLSA